jgi:hypothetical protein
MTINQMTQNMEIRFWTLIIPFMEEKGPLMKTIRAAKRVSHEKPGLIALLILVWAAIGFVSGIILGRIFMLLQIL